MKSLTEKQAVRLYNKNLKKVIKDLKNDGITTGQELNNYCALRIKNFKGVYMVNSKIPKYSGKSVNYIINQDIVGNPGIHWVAIYKNTTNRYFIYDSFGRTSRSLIYPFVNGKIYTDADDDAEQKSYQDTCGQRCISFLMVAQSHGINSAMKI